MRYEIYFTDKNGQGCIETDDRNKMIDVKKNLMDSPSIDSVWVIDNNDYEG